MNEPRPVVLLLTGGRVMAPIVYAALREAFGNVAVVIERKPPRWMMMLRRMRHQSVLAVAGQIGFVALILPLLKLGGRGRIAEIRTRFNLRSEPLPPSAKRVRSVNAPETIEEVRRLKPSVIVVSGTRILDANTIERLGCPLVNCHAGLTPYYRGVHGGYWALADRRPDLVGTTVHFIDAGVDTGPVAAQATFDVTSADSFATYPYLHMAAGLQLLLGVVRACLQGEAPRVQVHAAPRSTIRFHPTLGGYLWRRFRIGVK